MIEDDENIFAKTGFEIIEDLVFETSYNIGVERKGIQVDLQKIIDKIKEKPSNYSIEAFDKAIHKLDKYWY